MTTSSPRSPRLLLLATVILIVTGAALLAMPNSPSATAPAPTSVPHAAPAERSSSLYSNKRPTAGGAPVAAGPAVKGLGPASASAVPPHGEGAAGDRAIQQALEATWPADLTHTDERQLLTAGRALLRADATGIGRGQWPGYFGHPGHAVAPAFAAARFRIQAAIARRDGSSDRAVVHLVWAGSDRGGTYTDDCITDLHFTRTTPTDKTEKKGGSAWTWEPRT